VFISGVEIPIMSTAQIVFLPAYRTEPGRLLMLLRRAAADDRDAFTRLYDALLPQVTATARARLAKAGPILEVIAATFVEAWHCADQHTEHGTDVAGWINGIAARRAGEPYADAPAPDHHGPDRRAPDGRAPDRRAPDRLVLDAILHREPRRRI
jgi:DNA-directed RNA polymerase specialized sigma24 family protein